MQISIIITQADAFKGVTKFRLTKSDQELLPLEGVNVPEESSDWNLANVK